MMLTVSCHQGIVRHPTPGTQAKQCVRACTGTTRPFTPINLTRLLRAHEHHLFNG